MKKSNRKQKGSKRQEMLRKAFGASLTNLCREELTSFSWLSLHVNREQLLLSGQAGPLELLIGCQWHHSLPPPPACYNTEDPKQYWIKPSLKRREPGFWRHPFPRLPPITGVLVRGLKLLSEEGPYWVGMPFSPPPTTPLSNLTFTV